jgi:acylglycerol lipase
MSSSEYVEEWITGPKSSKFYTRKYQAEVPKAVVVFVHGFCEHIGRYSHIFPLYKKRGISVFAFDQRGFGRTALDEAQRSKDAVYGRTSWPEQFTDIEFFVKRAKNESGAVPIFLMGHSMGGGLVLGFSTRLLAPPEHSTVALLSGVIATSPLIILATPAPKMKRWVGEKVSNVLPKMSIPAETKPEDLSHDAAFNEAYKNDPLIKAHGTLRGVSDMLGGGEQLLESYYQHWPQALPLLIVHGSDDRVTSHKASEEFINKIKAADKKFSLYPGGFHELQNEPDGVKEKLVDECISFIEGHLLAQGQAKL